MSGLWGIVRPSVAAAATGGFGPVVSALAALGTAFWAMLPAYVPNNVAVLAGGGRPIDGGRTWQGERLLGDGKTWRGTAFGTVAGVALAVGLNRVLVVWTPPAALDLPQFPLPAAFGLAFGAMLGDVVASFFKRRTGRERGAPVPVVDQLDFVVGALLSAAVFDFGWVVDVFTLPVLAAVLVVTPLLHVLTNWIAYLLDVKNEPW